MERIRALVCYGIILQHHSPAAKLSYWPQWYEVVHGEILLYGQYPNLPDSEPWSVHQEPQCWQKGLCQPTQWQFW